MLQDVNIEETAEWLERKCVDDEHLTDETILSKYIVRGVRKVNVNDEVNFCDPQIVHGLFKAKVSFKTSVTKSKENFSSVLRG